jgi:hypothetical protein
MVIPLHILVFGFIQLYVGYGHHDVFTLIDSIIERRWHALAGGGDANTHTSLLTFHLYYIACRDLIVRSENSCSQKSFK